MLVKTMRMTNVLFCLASALSYLIQPWNCTKCEYFFRCEHLLECLSCLPHKQTGTLFNNNLLEFKLVIENDSIQQESIAFAFVILQVFVCWTTGSITWICWWIYYWWSWAKYFFYCNNLHHTFKTKKRVKNMYTFIPSGHNNIKSWIDYF